MERKTSKKSNKSTSNSSQAPIKQLEEYSSESNTFSPFQDPLDINRFLNLEDPIKPKIEENYPLQQEDLDYFNQFHQQDYLQLNPIPFPFVEPQTQSQYQPLTQNANQKILEKSKRIQKREKAKNRKNQINTCSQLEQIQQEYQKLTKMEDNYESINMGNIPSDPKMQKKMLQMIRNRISAQNSRDRKKDYINQLEETQKSLVRDKQALQEKIDNLLKELGYIKSENSSIKKELHTLKQKYGIKDDDFFEDPSIAKSLRSSPAFMGSFGTIGLALFSIITFFTLLNVGTNNQSQQSANLFSKNVENTQINKDEELNGIQQAFEKIESKTREYQMLKEINILQQNMEKQHRQMLEDDLNLSSKVMSDEVNNFYSKLKSQNTHDIEEKFGDNQPIVIEFKKNSQSDFLPYPEQDEKQENCDQMIAPVDYHNKVSTIYCPQAYKQVRNLPIAQEELMHINFQNNEWIQLMVNQKDIGYFSKDIENIEVQQPEGQTAKLIEIWAKIHSVKHHSLIV